MEPPKIPCPNCSGTQWVFEASPQSTASVQNIAEGQADRKRTGLVYEVFKCGSCSYAMFFIRPNPDNN